MKDATYKSLWWLWWKETRFQIVIEVRKNIFGFRRGHDSEVIPSRTSGYLRSTANTASFLFFSREQGTQENTHTTRVHRVPRPRQLRRRVSSPSSTLSFWAFGDNSNEWVWVEVATARISRPLPFCRLSRDRVSSSIPVSTSCFQRNNAHLPRFFLFLACNMPAVMPPAKAREEIHISK